MTTYEHTLKIRLKDNQETTPQKAKTHLFFEINLFCMQCFNPISKKVNKSPSKQLPSSPSSERSLNKDDRKHLNKVS